MAKITIPQLQAKKRGGHKISMMTAYDYPGAKMVEEAGIDMILIGDSLAMTILGYDSTVYVTMEEMLHHCRAVSRGAKKPFLVGDMPFMSYQADTVEAIHNAGRLIKEGQVDAVKLEGGEEMAGRIRGIAGAGIPILGHLGLTPQSATKLGGYRVQGKTAQSAIKMVRDALILQDAGCFMIVLEAVPPQVAGIISRKLEIPTIGIGAGMDCDGQVLVMHDMLGIFDAFLPRFAKRFAELKQPIVDALTQYKLDVENRQFPKAEHTYAMNLEELDKFMQWVNSDAD